MHIFLATDGSNYALGAERLLQSFPFPARPRLTVATVSPAADLHAIGPSVTGPVTELLDRYRQESTSLLQAVVDRNKSWASETTQLLLDGHVADELLRSIEQLHPDLVVVGSRGLGAVRRMLLGSVSERLVKHTRCSVLVAQAEQEPVELRSIVIAHDGSPAADAAIRRFSEFKFNQPCAIHLLGVIETVHAYGIEYALDASGGIDAEKAAVNKRLEATAKSLGQNGCEVSFKVCTSSDVTGAILDAAEERDADLIVMGSRGKSTWERFLLGSVSLRVLHQAPCSVWIERSPAQ